MCRPTILMLTCFQNIDIGQEYRGSSTFASVIQSSIGLFWNFLVPNHSPSSSVDPLPSQAGVCKLSAAPSGFLSRASFSKCVASSLYSEWQTWKQPPVGWPHWRWFEVGIMINPDSSVIINHKCVEAYLLIQQLDSNWTNLPEYSKSLRAHELHHPKDSTVSPTLCQSLCPEYLIC